VKVTESAIRPDLAELAALLRAAWETRGRLRDLAATALEPMLEKGVAHAHFRLRGHGLVLRVPRAAATAQMLEYQAECFRRAEPSGVTPRLDAVLAPRPGLPHGALLVEEVPGRPPRLPEELLALAAALARFHGVPLPPPGERAPLPDHAAAGPVAATLAVIERSLPLFAAAPLAAEVRQALEAELGWARGFAAASPAATHPIAPVATDTHPGNFIIRADGRAIFVDLEKTLYGSPAIDLAHATLFTSTSWDLEVQARLAPEETRRFYRSYLEHISSAAGDRLRPFLAPCRRLTWLRTMMWCTRWLVPDMAPPEGIDAALLAHIRDRVAVFFAPKTVASIRAEWLDGAGLEL
jgi:hypothetical protein